MSIPIDITWKLSELVRDISVRVPELSHITRARIAYLVSLPRRQTVSTRRGRLVGIRCRDQQKVARAIPFFVETEVYDYLMVINVQLFVLAPPEERLETIIHELWHAHPAADGRLRMQEHGRVFDDAVAQCERAYRANAVPESYRWLLELGRDSVISALRLTRYPKKRSCLPIPFAKVQPELCTFLLAHFGLVRAQRVKFQLSAVACLPTYRCHRCERTFEVHRKYRSPRACPVCRDSDGVESILVYVHT